MFKVECPGCKAPYQVDERRVPPSGLKMRCPKCGTSFQVDPPPSDPRGTSPAPVLGASLGFGASGSSNEPVAKKPPLPERGRPKPKGTMIGVAPPLDRSPAKPKIPRPRSEGNADLPARAAPRPPPPRGASQKAAPAAEPKEPVVDRTSEADLPAVIGSSADLPAVPAPSRGAATDDLELDIDLPARPASSTLDADLPAALSGFNRVDLPARVEEEESLPPPSSNSSVDLPSPLHDVDLPSPSLPVDLPSPKGARDVASWGPGAPVDFESDGFGELDLPMVGGDLPAPAASLPSPAASLPVPAASLPSPAASLPSRAAELPEVQADAAFGGDLADPFGGSVPPLGAAESWKPMSPVGEGDVDPFELPSDPDPFGTPSGPPDPFASSPDSAPDPFGRAPSASLHSTRPMAPDFDDAGDDGVVRKVGGGTEYGEVNLSGEDEAGAEVALDGNAREFAEEPNDMEFGELPGPDSVPDAPEPVQARQAIGGALAELQARQKRRRLRFVVAGLVVASLAGGALTLVPAVGPFGLHFIQDQLHRGDHERLLSDTVHDAQKLLGEDAYRPAKNALTQAEAAAQDAKRYRPLSAYAAYLGFATVIRFGPDSEVYAAAKVRLDELAEEKDGSKLLLAQAAHATADGQLARARQLLTQLASTTAGDIDAAALRGEVELRARDVKAAIGAWESARKLQENARTAFGLARATFASGDEAGARKLAERTLELNAVHVGAKILLARIVWDTSQKEDATTKLLSGVTAENASPEEIVNAQSLLGEVHLARGRITHAEKAFADALKLNPTAGRALSGLGNALFRAGRYSQALARFKAAAQADPDDVKAKVGIAKSSILLERLEEAKAMLEKMRASHPEDIDVAYWYGRVLELLGERQAAEKAYRDAIAVGKKEPRTVEAYVALANLQSQQGQLDAAAKTLREARETLPASPAIHKALGRVAMSQGRYADGLAEFQQALELDSEDIDAKFLVGSALVRLRKFEDALSIFEAVARVDRDYPGLALERGLLFQESGRGEEALKEYETALAKAPNDPDLMLKVGCGKAAAGNGSEAEDLLRKVLAQRPNSAETHHCLGRALMAKNNLSDALGELNRAVELDPNRAEYYLYVGWAANEAGDVDDAADALKKALELDQGLADAYWQRGVLRLRQTRPKDAIDDLTRALALRPSRHEAYAALADAYYDLGMESQALAHWQKAIAAKPDEANWRFRYGKLLNLNLRHADAAEQLEKAIELARAKDQSPVWLPEAHRLAAMSLGNRKDAISHYEEFLKTGPSDSPFRQEAIDALRRLGHPWEG